MSAIGSIAVPGLCKAYAPMLRQLADAWLKSEREKIACSAGCLPYFAISADFMISPHFDSDNFRHLMKSTSHSLAPGPSGGFGDATVQGPTAEGAPRSWSAGTCGICGIWKTPGRLHSFRWHPYCLIL